MNSKIIQKPTYEGYDVHFEQKKLSDFLVSEKIIVHPDFFKNIERGDIIEVYSFPENKQIYSNSEFKKLCSYTDEQMTTIPFPKLFWREESVHMELMKRASEVCALPLAVYSWNVPTHDLVESLHPRKRTFEVKMKKISPFFRENEEISCGFVLTLQVEFIFEWEHEIN